MSFISAAAVPHHRFTLEGSQIVAWTPQYSALNFSSNQFHNPELDEAMTSAMGSSPAELNADSPGFFGLFVSLLNV